MQQFKRHNSTGSPALRRSTKAANANGIDPALLAAIGVRETGFQNEWHSGAGWGAGVFQMDLCENSNVTEAQAFNVAWSANYAAGMLAANQAAISAKFPNFTAAQVLPATAASYNFGTKNISGNPDTIDTGTAGNNYGSNVMDDARLQMRESISRRRLAAWITAVVMSLCFWTCALASGTGAGGAGLLRLFLQKRIGWGPVSDRAMRYSSAQVSLDGKSPEQVLVYITGQGWCGTGGCTALLLQPLGSSFQVIDKFTLARLPIRVLRSKTNGWYDLTMPVAGGGVTDEHTTLLRFDGQTYPSNPSMAPKAPANLAGAGTEVPLSQQGSLVY